MLKVLYTKLYGSLTADIASVLTLLPVDVATFASVVANVNFGAGEWTYLKLSNSAYSEEVKVTGISGSMLVVQRGKSGSTPMAFSMIDTVVTEAMGVDAITDIIAANPAPSNVTVAGTGVAFVTNIGSAYTVNVDPVNLTAGSGLEILGTYPNLQVVLELSQGGCCPGDDTAGDGEGVTALTINSGILQGSLVGNLLTLVLPTPVFTGAGTTAVTGSWPNYTITSTGGGGGGTVTSVGVGAGLTLTGAPAVNPVISITNTGVTAGDYSGFVVNARGQITGLPVGFNPISSIVVPDGAVVSRVGGVVTITFDSADVGQKGLIATADETAPLDPMDVTSAVTPALLAAQLGGASGSSGAGTSTGEADASYTDTLAGTAITLTLASGESALLLAQVVMLNNTTPLTPVAFGIAVFDGGGVKKAANKKATQSEQSLQAVITGPFTGALTVKTTALPADTTVHTAQLAAIKF